MKKILELIIICFIFANANQYNIYGINGKNFGTFKGEVNKHTLSKLIKEYHGSILLKKLDLNNTSFINLNQNQHSFVQALKNEKNIYLSKDSLNTTHWIEVEKNEIVKICLDVNIFAWETSLNASIPNDSCITFQAPTLIGTETLNAYITNSDSAHKINLAVGMKFLDFHNNKVLLGYNEYKGDDGQLKWIADNFRDEEDPERIETITGTYLVDKYPVTNCEITQLMWDKITMTPSFINSRLQQFAEEWMFRKKNSERNKNCASRDTAACTIFLLQAMKYANARSIREGLKPYYKFSETKEESQKILSKGLYIIGLYDLTNNKDDFIQVSVDNNSDGYRLPYYDEWMMLARGGDKKNNAPWGDSSVSFEEASKYARFATWKKYDVSEPVGQLLPNGYGLYDMFGLVWEHVLFEEKNPFRFLEGRPSCLKGGDNHVKKNKENSFDMNPYWKLLNYGFYFSNYNGGMPAGFRLIRKLK